MSSPVYDAFLSALKGQHERVVLLPHQNITFFAQNFNGNAALVANIELRPDQVVQDGKGFSVSTDRSTSIDLVRIISADKGVSPVFLKLVDHILERTAEAEDSENAATMFVTAVDEFRRFGHRKPGRLGEEEIRGLVAELVFLLHLLKKYPSRTWDVFHAWGGPFGAKHDFEFPKGNAIEVKSSHHSPSEVRISSPSQIEPIAEGLDLIVLSLERVEPGSECDISLLDLVNQVADIAYRHTGDVAERWDSALNALGLDLDDEYYDQWRFIRGDWLRFSVHEGFPRIRELDVPDGVVKVAFSLCLNSLERFATEFSDLELLP